MTKATRLQWYDSHCYNDTEGLQAPEPTEAPICGADKPAKTTMRGYIKAGEVYHELGCCGKCKKAISKLLKD